MLEKDAFYLTCTLVFWLGDTAAVAIHDRLLVAS